MQLFERKFSATMCERCLNKFSPLHQTIDGVYCIYEYNAAMREYILNYKFLKDVYLAYAFRKKIHEVLQNCLKRRQGAKVVPIPMHEEHLRERTFAHVDELLNAAEIPYVQVMKKISSVRQSQKSKEERKQVKQLFELTSNVQGSHFILFDDVKTTGTTLALAKNVLEKGGAKSVQMVALAGRILK